MGTWVCRHIHIYCHAGVQTHRHPSHTQYACTQAPILYTMRRYTGVQAHTYPFLTPVCRHTGTHSPPADVYPILQSLYL